MGGPHYILLLNWVRLANIYLFLQPVWVLKCKLFDQKSTFLREISNCCVLSKVSVQGVVALGDHFATLIQQRDFYEAKNFSLLIFKKKRQILLHF